MELAGFEPAVRIHAPVLQTGGDTNFPLNSVTKEKGRVSVLLTRPVVYALSVPNLTSRVSLVRYYYRTQRYATQAACLTSDTIDVWRRSLNEADLSLTRDGCQ